MAAAVTRGVQVLPCVESGVAFVLRRDVPPPLRLARLRLERLEPPGRIEVVARPNEHVVADDDRRHRREVLLAERTEFTVPALFTRLRIKGDEVIVRGHEEEVVPPHSYSAVADVSPTLRLPEVVPEFVTIVRVERPRVVGRSHVEHAVHRQDGTFDLRGAGDRDAAIALTG